MGLTAVDSSLLIPAVAPWHTEHASADRTLAAVGDLRVIASVPGAIYDALIGATALEAGARLLSRDVRAASTYRAMESTSNWCKAAVTPPGDAT